MPPQFREQLPHFILVVVQYDTVEGYKDTGRPAIYGDCGRAIVYGLSDYGCDCSHQHADCHDVQLIPGNRGTN